MKKIFELLISSAICLMMWAAPLGAATYNDTEHWAKNYIDYVSEQGYMVGTSNTTFQPDERVTRGMFVTAFARYVDAPLDEFELMPFKDVAQEQYYTKAVLWAHSSGIVEGINEDEFAPDSEIKREEVAAILHRYHGGSPDGFGAEYKDWDDVSEWAKDGVCLLTENKIFVGDSGKFRPKDSMTRAEMAVMFCRLDGKEFSIYEVPKEKRTYIGTYRITYYCSGCSSTITAMGKRATVGKTVALPRSMWGQWSKYKGETIYIENIGYRVIEDKCGTGSFDVFCSGGCNYQPFNCSYQKIWLVE